jgi:hypothetical protein
MKHTRLRFGRGCRIALGDKYSQAARRRAGAERDALATVAGSRLGSIA